MALIGDIMSFATCRRCTADQPPGSLYHPHVPSIEEVRYTDGPSGAFVAPLKVGFGDSIIMSRPQ